MTEKYSWFNNHDDALPFTVMHTEEDGKETTIAITDTAEKADFIVKACNLLKILIDTEYAQDKTLACKNIDWDALSRTYINR